MRSKTKGSQKNIRKGGGNKMQKQNKKAISLIEQFKWFVNNPNSEAMGYYLGFDFRDKKWHCRILNRIFADIRDCGDCKECQKIFEILEEENSLEKENDEKLEYDFLLDDLEDW